MIVPRRDGQEDHSESLVRGVDVTTSRVAGQAMEQQMQPEPIIGLLDREGFLERVDQLLEAARGDRTRFILVLADLDRFRDTTKYYGPDLAEELLKAMALRVLVAGGADAVTGRCGNDAFALFYASPIAEMPLRAEMERLRDSLSRLVVVVDVGIDVSVSIGYVTAEKEGEYAERLLRRAELAAHAAKTAGGRRVVGFSAVFEETIRTRQTLLASVRRAMATNEFTVHYQPLIPLTADRETGCEALVRWNHPIRGLLTPAAFLDIFQDFSLMLELGHRIRGIVLADLARWRREGSYMGKVAINLGPADLALGNIAADLARSLEAIGASPRDMIVEVSETLLLRGAEAGMMLHRLHEFAGRGFSIGFDDFGTGHASLTHLRELPLDIIKIDRSFIAGIEDNTRDAALVSGMIDLAHRLGLTTIAEGVETTEQARLLRRVGCDVVQGFLLSRPVDADSLPGAVRRAEKLVAALEHDDQTQPDCSAASP